MTFLLELSGALTAGFLAIMVVLKFSEAAPALEGPCRAGLLVSGIAWICLFFWDATQSPVALQLYPLLLGLALFGPKLVKGLRWALEGWNIRRRKNWRCPSCGKENESIAHVCYFCQAWRKNPL